MAVGAIEAKMRDAASRRRRRLRLIAEGICVVCGLSASVNGLTFCVACIARNRRSSREAFRQRRLKALALYGGVCVCCGESEPDFLTFDHINNDGYKNRHASGSQLISFILRERPTDVQILCYNCNCARGHYGICPHKRIEAGERKGSRIRRFGDRARTG